jgi:hypothetical protein
MEDVATLALGSWPRQGFAKVRAIFHAPTSARECEGMNPTLPNELPLWELKSRWTPKSSESDFRGQNPLDWKFIYIIENILELRCLKWALMMHLGT